MIQFITILVCGCFGSWGGYNNHNARRYFMPLALALGCFLIIHSWKSVFVLAAMPFLTLKDDDEGLLGSYTKCMYGLLACLGASLGLFLTHHLGVIPFSAYLVISSFLYYAVKNLNQIGGDLIFFAFFGSIICFIH